jgi:hypothetical protein
MIEAKKITLTFEEIYSKMEKCEYVIVHTKEDMKPHLLNANDNDLYIMPEGYLEYDKRFYYRKY